MTSVVTDLMGLPGFGPDARVPTTFVERLLAGIQLVYVATASFTFPAGILLFLGLACRPGGVLEGTDRDLIEGLFYIAVGLVFVGGGVVLVATQWTLKAIFRTDRCMLRRTFLGVIGALYVLLDGGVLLAALPAIAVAIAAPR